MIVLICSFFFFITTACSSESVEEEYPEKSIQLVVSFSPGAATDTQARIISKYANKYLGEELVIVNKPGGGGQVGWNSFASTESDGYTLAVYNLPHIITQPLVGDTSYAIDTFEPIVNWGGDPLPYLLYMWIVR